MYGYNCEYCDGTVKPRLVAHEAFKHKDRFVILEDVAIGVCDSCGNRYYSADIPSRSARNSHGQESS